MTDWEARLSNYGTPVPVRTNLPNRERYWLTDQQHYILGHVIHNPRMGVRERARRLNMPPGTVSRNITRWCKVGILNRVDDALFLQRGVTVPLRTTGRPWRRGVSTIYTK